MRVGLIVDSACELPYSFIKDNNIFVLPVTVSVDGETFVDDHDPETTQRFYQSGSMGLGHQAETRAYTADQIYNLFMDQVVNQYDSLFWKPSQRTAAKSMTMPSRQCIALLPVTVRTVKLPG